MRIKRIGQTSATEITLESKDGDVVVLVSYETPVAFHKPDGNGFRKTSKKWSPTTSKQINKWIRSHGGDPDNATSVPQEECDSLLSPAV